MNNENNRLTNQNSQVLTDLPSLFFGKPDRDARDSLVALTKSNPFPALGLSVVTGFAALCLVRSFGKTALTYASNEFDPELQKIKARGRELFLECVMKKFQQIESRLK